MGYPRIWSNQTVDRTGAIRHAEWRFERPCQRVTLAIRVSSVSDWVAELGHSLQKMSTYLRVLSRDPAREQSPGFEAFIRTCVAGAPGVVSITSVEPHSRGGFAVIIERVESLPGDFDDHFERSELMLVI